MTETRQSRSSNRCAALVAVWLCALACSPSSDARLAPQPTSAPHAARPVAVKDARSELARRLDVLIREAVAQTPVAGAAVAIVWRGETVLQSGYGLADLEARTPVTPDTIFRIGSLTKQFTAAAIMALAEDGKLELDAPLASTLEYPGAQQLSARQLLTHSSGIPGYTELAWFQQNTQKAFPSGELVRRVAEEKPRFSPGTSYSYSNSGYYLLGLLIEKLSGKSYAEYLSERVLARAGLQDTAYCPERQDYPRAAKGYQRGPNGLVSAAPLSMRNPYSAGALCSTVGDLVRWTRALANGRVVRPGSYQQMIAPLVLPGGEEVPYGFGLGLGELDGHHFTHHGGGINGFVSYMSHFPVDDLVIAVLVNGEAPLAFVLGERLAASVLGVSGTPPKDIAISAEEAAPLVGSYEVAELGQIALISYSAGALTIRNQKSPTEKRMLSQGGGLYQVRELGLEVRFSIRDGRATHIQVMQGGGFFRGQRLP